MRSSAISSLSLEMSFFAIASMRCRSRSMTVCPLPAIYPSSCFASAHRQHQLALQVAPLADPVRLGRVSELIAGDRRRPDRAGGQQFLHALQMGAVAGDARPQYLDILARRLKA